MLGKIIYMTLVVDNRNALQDRPCMHAFIAGVSKYPHLPGGMGTPAPDSYGLRQLSSAAISAYKIYSWLLNRKNHFTVPLATCRLLLSATHDEEIIEPNLYDLADSCTLNNFLIEAHQWRDDAASNQNCVTFFYFVCHGVQRSTEDAVLLLEDFGDGIGGPLKNSIEFKDLFDGMAASRKRPNIAQTQLYFVDTCRIIPEEFKQFQWKNATPVFNDAELSIRDDRRAPVFYAAVPGSRAYARPKKQTIFCETLLIV